MRCPFCSEEIPWNSKFCDRCGARIDLEAQPNGTKSFGAKGLKWGLHLSLQASLGLEGNPVAVKLLRGEPPPGSVHELEEPLPHCHMVWRAYRGESLYGPSYRQDCKVGAICLGMADQGRLKEAVTDLIGGKKRFRDGESLGRYLQDVPIVPRGVEGILYAPLGEAPLNPDVIIVLGRPSQAVMLVEAYHYLYSRKLQVNLGTYFPLCAENIAGPLMMGCMTLALSGECILSKDRLFNDLMSVSFPYYMTKQIVKAVKILTENNAGGYP